MLDESPRMPSGGTLRSARVARWLVTAVVIFLGPLLRGRDYDQKQWIGLGVIACAVAVLVVLEYRAYRERKEGPPSLKS